MDEVFVSDLVLKLGVEELDDYMLKTIEVEKARSVSHVRGVHELQIRDGKGGHGGAIEDVADDPRIEFPANGQKRKLGYLQVIPSVQQKPNHAGEDEPSSSEDVNNAEPI